jgi:hypothetical protein
LDNETKLPQQDLPGDGPLKETPDDIVSSANAFSDTNEIPDLASQPSTINPQPSTTEDMEVHHHTHSGHGKKTWKNYFWEFLMLFLAVFCGFLAEYQLEHVIEHQREKEFIRSMVEDLQADHQQIDKYVSKLELGRNQMDSLITLLDDNVNVKQNGNLLYYFGRISPRLDALTINNRTFDQLKNSGGFRLIRNTNAAEKIMSYYGSIQYVRQLEELYTQEFYEYKKLASGIFEPSVFRQMERPDGSISREADNPSLQTNNLNQLKALSVFAVYMNGSRRSLIPVVDSVQKNGDELADYLKKAYKLE